MVAINKDGAKVSRDILAFAKTMRTVEATAHVLAVNATFHAALSGRADILNTFYNALSAAWQGSFRKWIGQDNIGKGWLAYSTKEGFKVQTGKSTEREAFQNVAETLDRPFWDIDSNPNVNIFDDKSVVGRIAGLVRSVMADDAKVSPAARAFILEMADSAANRLKGIDGTDKLASATIEAKAKVKAMSTPQAKAGAVVKAKAVKLSKEAAAGMIAH